MNNIFYISIILAFTIIILYFCCFKYNKNNSKPKYKNINKNINKNKKYKLNNER